MYKKFLSILLSMSLAISIFVGCAKTEANNETQSKMMDVVMRTGYLNSMNPAANPDTLVKGYPKYPYDDLNSLILALKSEKIDSIYLLPEVVARYIENNIDDVKAIEPTFLSGVIGLCMGTLKENNETHNLLNYAIDTLLNNGTIDRLNEEYLDRYLRIKEDPKPVDIPKIEGAKTLKIAVTGDMPPIDFVSADGKPAGFNVALLSEISKIINVNFELVQINSAARLTALKTNAVDAVFYLCQGKPDNKEYKKLEERDIPDEVVITKPYYTSRIYEVDTIDAISKAEAYIPSNNEQVEYVLNAGMFPFASLTEKEEKDIIKKMGYEINIKYLDNLNQIMLALRSGQIDYISLLPKLTAEYIKARNEDIILYKSPVTNNDKVKYCMATLEENKEAYNILNNSLNELIKDGTINNIENKYIKEFIGSKEDPKVVDMPHFDGAKTIKIAVTGDLPPFDFVSADGRPAGYNAALLSEIANRAKVNIELVPMDERAKVTALITKNIDAIFWLTGIKYDDERNTFYDCPSGVVLTDCYYEDDAYSVYLKDGTFDKMISAN